MGPKIPYGYRIVNGRAEADPVEAPKLVRYYEMVADGISAAVAARTAGIARTPTCCRNLLKYTVYLGTEYYPQIIPDTLWRTVSMEMALRGAPFVGKTGRSVTEPNPIQTQFAMDRSGGGGRTPVERATRMYERIRPRKIKNASGAPGNVSGAFSYGKAEEDQ